MATERQRRFLDNPSLQPKENGFCLQSRRKLTRVFHKSGPSSNLGIGIIANFPALPGTRASCPHFKNTSAGTPALPGLLQLPLHSNSRKNLIRAVREPPTGRAPHLISAGHSTKLPAFVMVWDIWAVREPPLRGGVMRLPDQVFV